MIKSLSGRFLLLTIIFVMLAEVLIFVPSIARFREDYLLARLERAQIASLATLENDMISVETEEELLRNAGIYNVVLRRDQVRRLALSTTIPSPIHETFDLRGPSAWVLIGDALHRFVDPEPRVIRIIGNPVNDAGTLIEVTLGTASLRDAMVSYGLNILRLSLLISVVTAGLLFVAVQWGLVRPINNFVSAMKDYQSAPEDARKVIKPAASITELREAEEALATLEEQLTHLLKQKDRLAQLGGAVSKISHDLRNILTSAQLFTDRIEMSEDPTVARLAPKLVNSITRAVNLCEATLAFGRAEEAAPSLNRFALADVVGDVIASEQLAVGDFALDLVDDTPAGMMIRADAEQLYRVVGNLVRNARQAIVATGKPAQIMICADETPNEWTIRIKDTGPGLPPKAQENLFKAFEGNARKGGTGLGLIISLELIRGHGGDLSLEASGPEGTCFLIQLPKSDLTLAAAAE